MGHGSGKHGSFDWFSGVARAIWSGAVPLGHPARDARDRVAVLWIAWRVAGAEVSDALTCDAARAFDPTIMNQNGCSVNRPIGWPAFSRW
jgi:hypothetical protein